MTVNIFSRPIALVTIDFDSPVTDMIMDLEHLRRRRYGGSTPYPIFLEMKSIFHLLESLGSARLEGNRTAIAEIVEENINPSKGTLKEQQLEVRNIENALQYADEYIQSGNKIDGAFIRELHKLIVKGLTPQSKAHPDGEGDRTPGKYRQTSITITESELKPPASGTLVAADMDSLVEFIRKPVPAKYDLIKTALVHHRFAAIHPFNNGNGRTVRALTYAMLLEQEFSVASVNRVLNPTAIFCIDRPEYVQKLAIADQGRGEDLVEWVEYVVRGLKDEIEKVDNLTDYKYVRDNIILPAIKDSMSRKSISDNQATVLDIAARNRTPIMSKNLMEAFPEYSDLKRSRLLTSMVEKNLLQPIYPKARQYTIVFSNNYLLRGVIEQLRSLGFIPSTLT